MGGMKHIAVVDDEAALRENVVYALAKEGYQVSAYANGLEAWEAGGGGGAGSVCSGYSYAANGRAGVLPEVAGEGLPYAGDFPFIPG